MGGHNGSSPIRISLARFQTYAYLNVLATKLLHYFRRENSGRKGSPKRKYEENIKNFQLDVTCKCHSLVSLLILSFPTLFLVTVSKF
jgi:hypothetical protein